MISIIDYGMGNLRSVEKGFLKVGVDVKVTSRRVCRRSGPARGGSVQRLHEGA
jgi:imidazoleglycerol phosphate synthase glutamine amidotransferase subunit HisH